ncbi:metallophosphoesterase family protein [Pajaroellobacter abortibovis]|uniref:Calcineurin-like phosphoesterase domain-containing protein n=1 Tax=Pajaroellobacter abortibovis TaxID=1882918 RepID=A0A1L6MXD0_9BACT|nr:metallophosphoesterase family protein [Pajaroellobacter abortibovis]APS00177.1 hypothetical protein BCY86_05400 [Pajaroellobacter abortibovis]
MFLLCISDIHGHLEALTTVLEAFKDRNVHRLLVAGDLIFPGPHPFETWKRLCAANAVMVQGVTDRALATLNLTSLKAMTSHEQQRLERMQTIRKELGQLILERLKRLPTSVRIPLESGGDLLLVHGAPADPMEPMTHDMTDEELLPLLGEESAEVVVCGMSHVPFDRTVKGTRIINVGSVGEAPHFNGEEYTPIAHATWIESTALGLSVEHITIPSLSRPKSE